MRCSTLDDVCGGGCYIYTGGATEGATEGDTLPKVLSKFIHTDGNVDGDRYAD